MPLVLWLRRRVWIHSGFWCATSRLGSQPVRSRQLDIPQNTMSAHLATLARAGLVRFERQGRTVTYRAEMQGLREMMLFLAKDCCGGRSELCAPLVADLIPCCPNKEVLR